MGAEDNEEAKLFSCVGDGDLHAFDALSRRLEDRVFGYACRLLHDRTEAEDIAQESLFRLYRASRNGRVQSQGQSVRSLLFAIAHNLAMDFLRKTRPVDIGKTSPDETVEQTFQSAALEQSLLREQIDLALAELPASHRSALLLREFGELSYAEIAQTLGATLNEVKVWIYRARKRLAELLDRDGQYVGPRKGESNHAL